MPLKRFFRNNHASERPSGPSWRSTHSQCNHASARIATSIALLAQRVAFIQYSCSPAALRGRMMIAGFAARLSGRQIALAVARCDQSHAAQCCSSWARRHEIQYNIKGTRYWSGRAYVSATTQPIGSAASGAAANTILQRTPTSSAKPRTRLSGSDRIVEREPLSLKHCVCATTPRRPTVTLGTSAPTHGVAQRQARHEVSLHEDSHEES